MSERSGADGERVIQVFGESSLEFTVDSPPEWARESLGRRSVGFECASGDWIEREYEALPAMAVLERVDLPGDTTHVQLESRDGYRACVPVAALVDAVIALGDENGHPRFVSPAVIGPRAIKDLASIRPLSLDAPEDPEAYERLPID